MPRRRPRLARRMEVVPPRRASSQAIVGIAAFATALVAVLIGPAAVAWASGREAIVPLTICVLLVSVIHPVLRHFLIVSLCYGIALLALRDTFWRRPLALPVQLDSDVLETVRATGLLLVTTLSAAAGTAETLLPGTVWARRCYFVAAGIYCLGGGILGYLWHHSWHFAILCVTGVLALAAALFADRIVASEAADRREVDLVSDEEVQAQTATQHARALRAKEWSDPEATPADVGARPPAAAS